VYPIPLLNCCKVLELNKPHEYTTTISIHYQKRYQRDIFSQLQAISEKTILFLQNINEVVIKGNVVNKKISVARKRIDATTSEIIYKGKTYHVLSDDGIVDANLIDDTESSESKRYSVKIAYSADLTFKDTVLYNYFKTQIPFGLPFVAHASLELNQNRNHSTQSKINPFVLKKLFQLHLRFIEDLKRKQPKSWLPYQTINKDKYTVYEPYARIIQDYWNRFEVYPLLSGMYANLLVAKNLGNRITNFIQTNNLEDRYEQQIVYWDLSISPPQNIRKPYNYKSIIEKLAIGLSISQRAELISLLLENYPNEKFAVLLDGKGELIETTDYVYTDKTADNKELKVPYYSNIRFLHPDLYKALIYKLRLQSETNKSRSLQDKLSNISDVHSFEPQTVIRKIISETTHYLRITKSDKIPVLREFYQILFFNYKLRGEVVKLEYDAEIPCLNQNNQIKNIKTLVLSDEFEMGILSKQIFGTLYQTDHTIVTIKELGLGNEKLDEIESFFRWLGINLLSIVEKIKTSIESRFISYSNKIHNVTISNYDVYTIKYLDRILNTEIKDINKIIGWLSLDKKVKDIFTNYTETFNSKEKLSYSYYRKIKSIEPFKNYIYYKLSQELDIQNYLITNKKQEWFNPFKIDYDYLLKINTELDKVEVDRILLFFGAKKDFNDLNINYLKEKTRELAERGNYKGSQVFYKSLVGHYKQNEQPLFDVKLYAREGKDIVVKHAQDIYFSDRIQLPETLTDKFPILYYPSRSGGSTTIEMFGLKNLNDLDLKIKEKKENEQISGDFEKYLKEIKPFILAFRLDKITKEDIKKKQVQQLNKLKIICCKELECSIENELFNIEPFNYIYSNNQFYIYIPLGNSLPALRQNKIFRNNLSDIFLKVFDTLDEKKTFETILVQSKEDNIYDINNELAEGILEESKILLGEISVRLSIWKAIFKIKKIDLNFDINDNQLEEIIHNCFPELINVALFNADDSLEEISRIRNVFTMLKIDLTNYNLISDYKLSYDRLFDTELISFYEEQKKNLKNQIWKFLSTQNREEQSKFIEYLHIIEHLLRNFSFNRNLNHYDFIAVLKNELQNLFSNVNLELDNDNYQDYDIVEIENKKYFSEDELLNIRRNSRLNSLNYFEGHIEYIKLQVNSTKEELESKAKDVATIKTHKTPKLIENFEVVPSSVSDVNNPSNGLWLGNKSELTPNQKKKLGNNVEEIVRKYLTESPQLYSKVELISKTNENEQYDIKYYSTVQKQMKFVECKYYNGDSFLISKEEKDFGYKNLEQYEIWLVNKDSKIFIIKDIMKLDLKPIKYKVKIKLKEYAV
jgi:hypothetical protein